MRLTSQVLPNKELQSTLNKGLYDAFHIKFIKEGVVQRV
jgi:hypothetical protein